MWDATAIFDGTPPREPSSEQIQQVSRSFCRARDLQETPTDYNFPFFEEGMLAYNAARRLLEKATGESCIADPSGEMLWSYARVLSINEKVNWNFSLADVFAEDADPISESNIREFNVVKLFWQICVDNKYAIFFSY